MHNLLHRIGRRGGALLVFSVLAMTYGIAIIGGWHPAFVKDVIIPIRGYGWIWLAVGLADLAGSATDADRWFYALSVFWIIVWLSLILFHWNGAFGWTESISWAGVLLLLFVACGWPEERR